jgi:acetyl-CoA acetyltransferase
VRQAYAGWVYGDSTSGRAALYGPGLSGIPIVNVNNYRSTGSPALFLARQAVASCAVDRALAVGFEQMVDGAPRLGFTDRTSPFARFDGAAEGLYEAEENTPLAPRYFGGAGREHMDTYGTSVETFARIAVKARRHGLGGSVVIAGQSMTTDYPSTFEADDTLLSKGHPLGATGLAQCTELVWQLRGTAGPREVDGARHALAHSLGLGGACVVTLYSTAGA